MYVCIDAWNRCLESMPHESQLQSYFRYAPAQGPGQPASQDTTHIAQDKRQSVAATNKTGKQTVHREAGASERGEQAGMGGRAGDTAIDTRKTFSI